MDSYMELKERHQSEVNAFPMAFAFSDKQFEEGMVMLGLNPTDTDKVYSLPGTGGFYKKTDAETLYELFERHEKEMKLAIENDITGDGFVYQMFNYELANHEYSYTGEIEDTLDSLGFTLEDVSSNSVLLHGLEKACSYQMKNDCFN